VGAVQLHPELGRSHRQRFALEENRLPRVPGQRDRDRELLDPTSTTAPGATSFATPPLLADKAVYFVVRAEDQAGNIDGESSSGKAGTCACDKPGLTGAIHSTTPPRSV